MVECVVKITIDHKDGTTRITARICAEKPLKIVRSLNALSVLHRDAGLQR